MIEYLKGRLIEKNPAYAVLECDGVGYYVNISVNTFESMGSEELTKLYIHEVIREDSRSLFGFANIEERLLFRNLISVNGVGSNTARVILSSYKPGDIHAAIINENSDLLKSIKGIGAKTAQRVIIDLKDKISKDEPQLEISSLSDNTLKDEALSALMALGFDRNKSIKVLQKVQAGIGSDAGVELVIKEALKLL
ncbi:MAG: Holliday junction branch migration protein RuvA [Crocinitomicaceae bacterium]|nr:Holliday junction branch migration protein RuvA [Crocinitomicaceae bacterium]|tara:strand:- start:34767 stop:35351 length:585 start_codon:yes stop_codon:yes gene_type:complete